MFFRWSKDKPLKMVWEVESAGVSSYLLGTAHFFPYSFRASLNRLIRDAHVVVLEGPLDEYSMAKVEHAGVASEGTPHLFDNMDTRTIAAITDAVTPYHRDKSTTILFNVMNPWLENPAYTMVKGMKPWRAFFSLYWGFLQSQGWKYSVDLEAYSVAQEMKKKIVFLESIEEQIEVLESLSMDQMIDFLKRADRWRSYTKEFVTWYLKGDPEKIKSNRVRFPTRHPRVIEHRDEILFNRMLPYLEAGNSVVCVGVPHIVGINKLLLLRGYHVRQWNPVTARSHSS